MCMYIHVHVFSLSLPLAIYNTIIISRNRYIKLFLGETRLVAFDATREGKSRKFYSFFAFFFLSSPRNFRRWEKENENDNTENALKKLSKEATVITNSGDKEKRRKFSGEPFALQSGKSSLYFHIFVIHNENRCTKLRIR